LQSYTRLALFLSGNLVGRANGGFELRTGLELTRALKKNMIFYDCDNARLALMDAA
jgi:hypothetical protein